MAGAQCRRRKRPTTNAEVEGTVDEDMAELVVGQVPMEVFPHEADRRWTEPWKYMYFGDDLEEESNHRHEPMRLERAGDGSLSAAINRWLRVNDPPQVVAEALEAVREDVAASCRAKGREDCYLEMAAACTAFFAHWHTTFKWVNWPEGLSFFRDVQKRKDFCIFVQEEGDVSDAARDSAVKKLRE